ncbi:MAG: DUF3795 domain-containing protein [Ignavibacteriales bacterium]|nr:DUF3795 domain-containing protein [Ignavibacteriales bacterium]
MEEILARCGYRCDLCPAFNPNIKSFDDKKKISEKWHQYFDFYLAPEEIGCDGCLKDAKLLDSNCTVRPCVLGKELVNCGYCNEFGCDKLKTRMDAMEEAIKNHKDISKEDYNLYIQPYESRNRLMNFRKK